MGQLDWFDSLVNYLDQVKEKMVEFLPSLLAATVLVLLGWLLAHLLRAAMNRLIPRLSKLIPSRAIQQGLRTSGIERIATDLVAGVLFWLVMILFLAAATETLGLPVVSTLVSGLARYLPSILAAALIVLAGVVLGNITRTATATAATSAGLAYGDLLGRTAQIVILLVASVVAVDQVGIDSTFLMVTLAIVLLATLGGMALGFGLGARTIVSNLLAAHYLLQNYKVGQRVRVGDTEGRIMEITNGAVILDTPTGRALVPAHQFSVATSVLLMETHQHER